MITQLLRRVDTINQYKAENSKELAHMDQVKNFVDSVNEGSAGYTMLFFSGVFAS